MTRLARLSRVSMTITTVAMVGTLALPGLASASAKTIIVSQSGSGAKGNDASGEPNSSKSGRYIAFNSDADNLVGNDTNGLSDCFVRDAVGKETWRVSVPSGGGEANGWCFGPAISDDGRFIAFETDATNLGGSTNGVPQVFMHDRDTNTTTLLSERKAGGQGGNGRSGDPAMSGNGRFVVWESDADNLVDGDTNSKTDVFLYDRTTDGITRVSVSSNGRQANRSSFDPDISANGAFIVFESAASNLARKDTNRLQDIFIHNRLTGATARVSVNSRERQANGASANPVVSSSGQFVAFESRARNLAKADGDKDPDVYLRDRKKGKTIQVSLTNSGRQPIGWSGDPTISDSGRYIAFKSSAYNLVRRDRNKQRDAFVRDRVAGKTTRVSLTVAGKQAWGGASDDPSISGDGRFVTFESGALNMYDNDTNGEDDLFRRGALR